MAKITMQEVADAAGVSRITVWKTLTGRPGVSSAKRQMILDKANELGYKQPGLLESSQRGRTFSLVVSRPESSAFWMNIIHHIAKVLSNHNFNMMYTYMPTGYQKGYRLPASLSTENCDGFIVLNVYDEQLLKMLVHQPLPKVFLDTVPSLKPEALRGDLLLLDGRGQLKDITTRLLDGGYARLGFIGDINYAQTNYERYCGFVDAFEAKNTRPDHALLLTGPLHLRSHYEDISAFLDGLPSMPEAIVCCSDFIANFVSLYLQRTEREVPNGFVLTGFDNSGEYPNVANRITTVNVETASLGRLLASKMMYRAQYPDAPTEVSYLRTDVIWREPPAQ